MYKKGINAQSPTRPYASSSSTPNSSRTANNPTSPQSVAYTRPKEEELQPHPTPAAPQRHDSGKQKDLMISYSHADKEIMMKIRDALEQNGISVWVDVSGLQAGVDFLSKIGEAIIDCKLFLSLLSASSVKSKYVQDELALAYVSNRSIFPVALEEQSKLKPLMDTGMKLQLARYEWTWLGRDVNSFNENFEVLLKKLKDDLINQQAEKEVESKKDEEKTGQESSGRPPLERQDTRHKLNEKRKTPRSDSSVGVDLMEVDQFWRENIGSTEETDWDKFVQCFKSFYSEVLNNIMSTEEQDWLMGILKRELEVEELDGKEIVYKFNIMAFCNIDGQYQPLWDRVKEQASESLAMGKVFDMDSTVRVEAIENLGKFRSAAVIDALRDLLADQDANVRAVATISLARTEAKDPVTIKFLMKTLNDKDRLVREAGCLALGHLQAKQAVNKLLHMWRNDVISHVREAANVALGQIGGSEVEKAMKVTQVLADEIRKLTTS